MPDWWHFRVVAYLQNGERRVTPIRYGLTAAYPESAARKWLWTLAAADRAALDRLIVWAPDKDMCATPRWAGPQIVYRRVAGRLVETERRDQNAKTPPAGAEGVNTC